MPEWEGIPPYGYITVAKAGKRDKFKGKTRRRGKKEEGKKRKLFFFPPTDFLFHLPWGVVFVLFFFLLLLLLWRVRGRHEELRGVHHHGRAQRRCRGAAPQALPVAARALAGKVGMMETQAKRGMIGDGTSGWHPDFNMKSERWTASRERGWDMAFDWCPDHHVPGTRASACRRCPTSSS
jgi:hypothetical protein